MQSRHSVYAKRDGYTLIELKLREPRELFNTLDPAPFQTKDLRPDAEEYLVGAMREIGPRQPAKLIVYLPEAELANARADELATAVRNYFFYRADRTAQQRRRLLLRGLASLAIALVFMSVCLSVRQAYAAWRTSTGNVVEEGLLILGWVAMWRPIEIFLYDWWPYWREQRVLRQLASIPIELQALP